MANTWLFAEIVKVFMKCWFNFTTNYYDYFQWPSRYITKEEKTGNKKLTFSKLTNYLYDFFKTKRFVAASATLQAHHSERSTN